MHHLTCWTSPNQPLCSGLPPGILVWHRLRHNERLLFIVQAAVNSLKKQKKSHCTWLLVTVGMFLRNSDKDPNIIHMLQNWIIISNPVLEGRVLKLWDSSHHKSIRKCFSELLAVVLPYNTVLFPFFSSVFSQWFSESVSRY